MDISTTLSSNPWTWDVFPCDSLHFLREYIKVLIVQVFTFWVNSEVFYYFWGNCSFILLAWNTLISPSSLLKDSCARHRILLDISFLFLMLWIFGPTTFWLSMSLMRNLMIFFLGITCVFWLTSFLLLSSSCLSLLKVWL